MLAGADIRRLADEGCCMLCNDAWLPKPGCEERWVLIKLAGVVCKRDLNPSSLSAERTGGECTDKCDGEDNPFDAARATPSPLGLSGVEVVGAPLAGLRGAFLERSLVKECILTEKARLGSPTAGGADAAMGRLFTPFSCSTSRLASADSDKRKRASLSAKGRAELSGAKSPCFIS
jgi:hypothetical protein